MKQGLFAFILKHSRRQQAIAVALTLASIPLLYASLELPKVIINEAIGSEEWPRELIGHSLPQLTYLLVLCAAFFSLATSNAYIRHRVNLLKAAISVQLLSRLRQILVSRVLRFPLAQFKKIAPGEIASMVMFEVGPFGRFFGDSIAVPVFELAMFITILTFVFAQDLYLGLAATAMIPFQAYLVPRLQRRINELTEEILVNERELTNRITEVVDGVEDIHAHDSAANVLEGVRDRLDGLAAFRMEASYRASFMKFCNTILGHLSPFLFYLIGGWLVIRGALSFGALVATLAAYRDLAGPWKDLLDYYQDLAEARTKFNVVVRQFNPDAMWRTEAQGGQAKEIPHLNGPIEAVDLGYVDDDGRRVLNNVNFRFEEGEKVIILSKSSNARDVIASILSRLDLPTDGHLQFADLDARTIHQSITGIRIAQLGSQPAFFNMTVGENLFLALSSPIETDSSEAWVPNFKWEKAKLAPIHTTPDHPWLNPELVGLPDRAALRGRTLELIHLLELDADIYALGLRQHPRPTPTEDFAANVVAARTDVRESLVRLNLQDLVQPFDPDQFNAYSTVGENILFGEASSEGLASDRLATSPPVMRLLRDMQLETKFLDIGFRCAETLVELLRGLPPGHAVFEQYSLVTEVALPKLTEIIRQVEQNGMTSLSLRQRRRIMNLTFGLAPQRHRLGLIDDDFKREIVDLRHALRRRHPELLEGAVCPYDEELYNPDLSIISNLVFGRIMFGRGHAETRVIDVVEQVVERRGLRDAILLEGLEAGVGVAGQRLSVSVRQKLGIIRSLLKRPDVLVINDMLNALDSTARSRIASRVLKEVEGATIIWLDTVPPIDVTFDRTYRVEGGQILELESDGRLKPAKIRPIESMPEDPLVDEASLLRDVPLLAGLDWVRLRLLAFTSERREYRAGDTIFQQGSGGEAAYVILIGTADIVVEGDQIDTVLNPVGPGQMVGEVAMLCDTPRSATVRAKTDLTALRLNREVFFETMRQDPAFSFEVARDLGNRLVRTTAAVRSPQSAA